MAHSGDYSAKAAAFLKQWQEQMSRQMRDPDVIRSLLAAMQSFGAKPDDETARKPAAAADAADDAVRQLGRRLDAVERQLERLVSLVAKTQNPARTKPRPGKRRVEAAKRPMAASKRRAAKKPKSKSKIK